MSGQRLVVQTTDYHTGGEPFRIVTGGIPPLQGATVPERRAWAAEHLDEVRRLLVNEPRGHADMYGGFVTPPDDEDGDLGVVFFHNDGFSTACGHGTIALAAWAIESGVLPRPADAPTTQQLTVDVPSGRLQVTAVVEPDGRVTEVRFVNVPSFVAARDVEVPLPGDAVLRLDVAFGGAFYAVLPAAALGVEVTPAGLAETIDRARLVKDAINAGAASVPPPVHPGSPHLRDIYGVIVVEEVADDAGAPLVQRNVTVFADGEVDRSATGSGTSARLALLHADGRLPDGRVLENRSVIDSVMRGRVLDDSLRIGGLPAVSTEVSGAAYLTGHATHVLRHDDPLGTGFLLR